MTNETRAEIATRLRAIADAIEAGADPCGIRGVQAMTWDTESYEQFTDYDAAVSAGEEIAHDLPSQCVDETEVALYIVMQRGETYDASEGDAPTPQMARRLVSL